MRQPARILMFTSGECGGPGERFPTIARNGMRWLPPGARHGAVVLTSSHTAATGGSDRRTATGTNEQPGIRNTNATETPGARPRVWLLTSAFKERGNQSNSSNDERAAANHGPRC